MGFPQRAARHSFLSYGGLLLLASLIIGLTAQRLLTFSAQATNSPQDRLSQATRQPLALPGKNEWPQARTAVASSPQQTVVPITSGTPQTGTVGAASQGACALGATQYSIPIAAEARRLQISLTGNQDVDLYARFNTPISVMSGQLVADYSSDSAGSAEDVTITQNNVPPLQVGTYYLAITNCGASAANITLTATITNAGGGQLTEELKVDDNSAESGFIGNGLIYVNRLTPLQYPSRLKQIRINCAPLQNQPNPSGAQIRLLAFNLPANAPPPTTPTYLLDRMVTLPSIMGLLFVDFDVSEMPEITGGDWYVGFQAPNPAIGVAVILDVTSVPQGRTLVSLGTGAQPFEVVTDANAMIRAVVLSGGNAVANVSAASFSGEALAANSIVAGFGAKLATGTASANTQPLPTTLAGTTIKVRDSAGAERQAQLFFVSPTQANFLMPPGTANGAATVTVTSGDGTVSTGTVNIVSVAPGLLSANANGQGVAAGFALRVKADNSQVLEPLATFDAALNRFVALPIDVSNANEQVFLILFGTGFRGISRVSDAVVRIGGQDTEVSFAGAQGDLAGLDQVNARLSRSLAGRGEVDVLLAAGGRNANVVRVSVK